MPTTLTSQQISAQILTQAELHQNFVPKLKDHMLTWLLEKEYNGDEQKYTNAERNSIQIQNN